MLILNYNKLQPMKKLIYVLFSALVIFFAACSGKNADGSSIDSDTTTMPVDKTQTQTDTTGADSTKTKM